MKRILWMLVAMGIVMMGVAVSTASAAGLETPPVQAPLNTLSIWGWLLIAPFVGMFVLLCAVPFVMDAKAGEIVSAQD